MTQNVAHLRDFYLKIKVTHGSGECEGDRSREGMGGISRATWVVPQRKQEPGCCGLGEERVRLVRGGSCTYGAISGGTEGGLDDKQAGNSELTGRTQKTMEAFQSLEPAL